MRNSEDDPLIDEAPQHHFHLGGCLTILVTFVANALLGYERAIAIGVATGTLIVVIIMYKRAWHRLWFQITFGVLVAIHGAAILLVPWPSTDMPGFHAIPFVFADVIASLGIIWLVKKAMRYVQK